MEKGEGKLFVTLHIRPIRNAYIVSQTLGIKWHLTGIKKFRSLLQVFTIVMTTGSITGLLLSNCISVIQWQRFGRDLYIPDAAEEISDRRFVEVTMKQIGSYSNMADALTRWTHLRNDRKTELNK